MQEPETYPVTARDLEARGDDFLTRGEAQSALECFNAALLLAAGGGRLHAKAGSAYFMMNQVGAAVDAFRRAKELMPASAAVLTNLGAALATLGSMEEAIGHLRHAVSLQPHYSIGHYNLGRALASTGDLEGARIAFQTAAAIDPISSSALIGLGQTHMDLGALSLGIECFRRALQIDPQSSEALMNLALAAQEDGDLFVAKRYYEQTLTADPRNHRASANLATVYLKLGRWQDSRSQSHAAMELDSTNPKLRSNFLFGLDFDPSLSPQEISEAHLDFENFMSSAPIVRARLRSHSAKLKIGYVSADFRAHACAHFMLPLLRSHDPATMDITCYSASKIEDAITLAFKSTGCHWRVIADLDDKMAAELIARDQIDILVDCSGHTEGNRLGVFAQRPATHAVAWLGYGNTTGLRAIDYRFTDEVLSPSREGNGRWAEKLVRLPGGFITYDFLASAIDPAPPPLVRNGHITFGSFNDLGKLDDRMIGTWCRVLEKVEGSRLILKDRHFDFEEVRNKVLDMFAKHGIATARLSLLGFTPAHFAHLAAFHEVDVCFDTQPYSGCTTTCDALWMGVPVITIYGDRYTSRQSASILTRVGLADLIARNPDHFVEIAALIVANPTRLATLRNNLRETMTTTPIGNASVFATDVENAYRAISGGLI